jgi:hypothetical protein
MVQRITHVPCPGTVICAPAPSRSMVINRGPLGCDLCQPHTLHGGSISSRSALACMAQHLSVGCAAWAFMGHLEACRAWLRVDRAWGGACIRCDWFAAQFECLDQLAAFSWHIVGILRAWSDSSSTWTIHPHPGLVAILPARHPADSGFAFHTVS